MTEPGGSTTEVTAPSEEEGTPVQRECFVMRLDPERVAEYRTAHASVWSDVLDGIRSKGWSNYSLFVQPEEGLVVGYRERHGAHPEASSGADRVNDLWQESMAQFFAGGERPDRSMQPLEEYFHLD